jgi:hypothetical protein
MTVYHVLKSLNLDFSTVARRGKQICNFRRTKKGWWFVENDEKLRSTKSIIVIIYEASTLNQHGAKKKSANHQASRHSSNKTKPRG